MSHLRVFAVVLSLASGGVHASVIGDLFLRSNGTMTTTINSVTFDTDLLATCALGSCNSEIALPTSLTFNGCASGVLGSAGCLFLQEGVKVDPISIADVGDSTFMTFWNHPNLDFSLDSIYMPNITANCASLAVGQSCVIYPGSFLRLTQQADGVSTILEISVSGKASDSGAAGLAAGSDYTGDWSERLIAPLPGGFGLPTPENIQRFFCGTNTGITGPDQCSPTEALFIPNDGAAFVVTASVAVPEPESLTMALVGTCLIFLGAWSRRRLRW